MVVVPKVLVPSDINPERKIVMVDNMKNYFTSMGENYSPKMHYIHKHLQELLENQFYVSDEHGKRVHQTMRLIKERISGKNPLSMISEYTWRECT